MSIYALGSLVRCFSFRPSLFVLTLCVSFGLSFESRAQSGTRPVVVTADQPNVWTLDQAHYLLAQMHRRNLDLKAEGLGELNPNDINGFRIDALRSILDISAEFDEAIGQRNRETVSNRTFNGNRRRELLEKRDRLNEDVLETTKKIAELKAEKARTTDEQKKAEIQATIDELEVVREVAKEQITQINTELGTLSQSADLTTPNPERASTTNGASPAFGTALTKAVDELLKQFSGSPKLNASLRLDNYIQMQYEILSKQLTLLRDEVGANEKLIFLEMPQSINTSYDKADNKWVQSWWNVSGYTRCTVGPSGSAMKLPCSRVLSGYETKFSDSIGGTELNRLDKVDEELKRYEVNLDITSYDLNRTAIKRILTAKSDDFRQLEKTMLSDLEQIESIKSARESIAQKSIRLSECRSVPEKASNTNANVTASQSNTKPSTENSGEKCKQQKNALTNQIETAANDLLSNRDGLFEAALTLNKFIAGETHKDFDGYQNISTRIDYLRIELEKTNKLLRRTAIADTFSILMPASNVHEPMSLVETTVSGRKVDNRSIRIVDMFPKQSSLNVNDLRMTSNAFSFKGLLKLLSGFGLSSNYERNRERYSQFVQQELYSSSFGKGAREFGWTFNPMPGTKRVASGARTTFAVMIVPKDTTGVFLRSKGCYFSRSAQEPQNFADTDWLSKMSDDKRGCSAERTFYIEIPDAGNREFFATAIKYSSVEKGKRVVLTIYGRGFTSQIGILVNGVPLRQSLGLAQPFIVDDGKTQEKLDKDLKKEVDGTFERVDSNQLVASFRLDDKFEGIPASIALIAPGKSIELRTLSTQFYVNDNPGWAMADFMFGKRPVDDKGALKVSKVSAYKLNGKLKVIITGDNLDRAKYVWINGEYPQMFRDPKVLNFDPIAPPKEKIIEVILVTDEGASIPAVIDNPFYEVEKTESAFRIDPNELAFGDAKLVKCYEFGAKTKRADFQLGGLGFKPAIELFMGTTKLKSRVLRSNLLEVEIPDPEDEPEIEVRDKVRGLKAIVRVYFSRPSGGCKVLPTTP